jgi:hypothetical protein
MKYTYPKYVLSLIVTLFITLAIAYFFYGYPVFVPSYTAFQITVHALTGAIFFYTIKYYSSKYAFLAVAALYLANMAVMKNLQILVWVGFLLFFSVSISSVLIYNKIYKIADARELKWRFILSPVLLLFLYVMFSIITLAVQFFFVYAFSSKRGEYPVGNLYIAWLNGLIKSSIAGFGLGLGFEVSAKIIDELKEKI